MFTSDGYTCLTCGAWVGSGNWLHECSGYIPPYAPGILYPAIPLDPIDPFFYPPINPHLNKCEHCFCENLKVNNKQHLKCCNCGTQKVK